LDEAESALRQAERAFSDPKPDVLSALQLSTQAEAIADEILLQVQQEEERRAREAQLLAVQLQAAETSFNRASDFIAVRRNGIGRTARTRLAEADRFIEQARALANQDVRRAIEAARRGQDLAEDAYRLAVEDFEDYDHGGRRRRHGGGIFPIPFPIPTGGWGGGGWGGTPWGSSGGGHGGSVGGGWSGGGGHGGSVGGRW
jgi:hypothetical protein